MSRRAVFFSVSGVGLGQALLDVTCATPAHPASAALATKKNPRSFDRSGQLLSKTIKITVLVVNQFLWF
jgi:hypothetical protein